MSSYKNVNIHEAKTHFSQLVKFAAQGNEVIICNAGEPMAKLGPIKPIKSQKRVAGTLANKIIIADDFDEMPDEFMSHFK